MKRIIKDYKFLKAKTKDSLSLDSPDIKHALNKLVGGLATDPVIV